MTGLGAAALLLAQVELRGLESAPAGEVAAVDARGVEIVDQAGSRTIVTWDRIKSVGGDHAAAGAPFMALADKAWRARTRLERGDAIAAEPLFEELFRTTRTQAGPSAAVIAEGLLRCRLRRGAHVLAAEAWLALVHASSASGPAVLHADWADAAGLQPVIDAATGLAAATPPIWCGPNAAQAMAGLAVFAPATPDAADKAACLAALYGAAARFEAGQPASIPEMETTDAGVVLVRQIVLARAGDDAQRPSARAALEARLPRASASSEAPLSGPASWMEAWCRVAVGRSLLREPAREQKQLGVLALLHVPARLGEAHPYLTGIALAEASVALRDMGDASGADLLLDELRSQFPEHPVWEWSAIRLNLKNVTTTPSAVGAPADADQHGIK